jgi:hypothetical protein
LLGAWLRGKGRLDPASSRALKVFTKLINRDFEIMVGLPIVLRFGIFGYRNWLKKSVCVGFFLPRVEFFPS